MTVQDPSINIKSATLNTGESVKLKLTGTNQKITWKSSNSSVASVKNGTVTAKSAGTTTISATALKKRFTCKIVVPEVYSLPAKQLIYKGNNVKIWTKGISSDSESVKLKIYIENKSDLNLGFNAHSFAVNGIMTNESIYYMDVDVPAGKKAQTTLDIKKSWMRENKIKDIKSMDIMFWAYDNDTWFKAFDTGVVLIGADYRAKIKGTQVYNKNGIVVRYIKKDGNKLYYAVRNNGNDYIDIDLENLSVNDWSYSKFIYGTYNIQILPHCEKMIEIELDSDFISENSISKIKKIELGFEVEYADDYMNSVHTDVITTNL